MLRCLGYCSLHRVRLHRTATHPLRRTLNSLFCSPTLERIAGLFLLALPLSMLMVALPVKAVLGVNPLRQVQGAVEVLGDFVQQDFH